MALNASTSFYLQNDLQKKFLLCLVEIVGSSVVDIVAEAGGNHGKGLEVGVVFLQFACLLGKIKRTLCYNSGKEDSKYETI